jgi:2',3'-cyclic-nucleotide 2'-phosphodiesterase (5'-nucleotidase family)
MDPLNNRITQVNGKLINCRENSFQQEENNNPADSVSLGGNTGESIKLNILHTNDLHGRANPFKTTCVDNRIHDEMFRNPGEEVGGLARIAEIVHQEREKNPDATLLLDAGDISTGTPVSDFYHAEPMIHAMNQMGYDAMTIGNHEFDKGKASLKSLVDKSNFPILAANLVDLEDDKNKVAHKPYVIKEVAGVKVGILGLTTPDALGQMNPMDREKIEILTASDTAKRMIPRMREDGAEFIVALTHLGLREDKKLAEEIEGIDVIVGGHSHSKTDEIAKVNDTLIVQSGAYGKNLGSLELTLTKQDGDVRINEAKSRLIPITDDIPKDPKVESVLNKYNDQLAHFLEREVGKCSDDLIAVDYHSGKEESNLANFFTDTLREATGADVCLLSMASFRNSIKAGDVKVKDVYTTFPWDDGLSMVTMSGRQIMNSVEKGLKDDKTSVAQSGLRVSYDPCKPYGERIVEIKKNDGESLDPDKFYKVVSRNYMVNNPKQSVPIEYLHREYLIDNCQDLIVKRFETGESVNQKVDGRIQAV